ncbi:MAG: hypothetical protein ACI4I6_07575 [Hominimerdicola sp.]
MSHLFWSFYFTTYLKNNVLYLECRGCYFFEGDSINKLSDVGNYRVGAYTHKIQAKNGRSYILEFTGYDRKEMRYTALRTGKPLKHPKYETVLKNALHIDTEFEKLEEGGWLSAWRDGKLEKEIHDKKIYLFTKADILRAVNDVSIKQYDKIVLLSNEKLVDRLPMIYSLGGYRERTILDNLVEVKTKQYTKEYHVYTFISENGDTFDYDSISNRITG